MIDTKLLAKLCNVSGVSGYEDAIQALVEENLAPHCDQISRDRMGNLIAFKKATSPPAEGEPLRVLIAAHADEIGAMVKSIDEDGFIHIESIGYLPEQAITSQPVVIRGYDTEPVYGVVAPNLERGKKCPTIAEALIDTGLPRAEVVKRVQIGDIVNTRQEFEQLSEKIFLARNFDDRLGTYCMIEAMKRIGETSVDIYAASTVQEEPGIRGCFPAAFAIEPEIGIALDGSPTWGAHVGKHEKITTLGEGTGIYLMDPRTISDPRLVRFLIGQCEKNNIPYQRNIGGGTDASAIQRSGAGALSTTVGPPTRYMHSTVQLAHADDIESNIAMLVAFLENAQELTKVVR